MATTTTPPTAQSARPPASERDGPRPIRPPRSGGPLPVRFYRSAVGKKWVMAITGVILMGFVLAHMIGNLKLYLSKEEINLYGEALRNMPGALLPRTVLLWTIRIVLIGAFVFHIHSAMGLTLIATGEHYFFDLLLGWLYAGAVMTACGWWERRRTALASPVGDLLGRPT